MSSTNHTTNYNLPQFLGADKPAWLGDINPAFSAIDTQMKANDTKAQKGVDDAATAQGKANDAYTLADGAKTDAGTAQGTANTAIANISTLANKFNIVSFTTKDNLGSYSDLTLAQNTDGSLFKFYGIFQINLNQSVARTAIAGLTGYYGVATGLYLNSLPSTAYVINYAGVKFQNDSTNGKTLNGAPMATSFAVGTDGQIYLNPTTNSGNEAGVSGYITRWNYLASLYFNGDFGDTPTPEE